jgi:hypothetical protein
MRLERDDGGRAVEAQGFLVAVHGAQDDGERPVAAGGNGNREGRIDGEAHTVAREGDAWRDAHGASVERYPQSPRDAAESQRVAHVEHGVAQSILHVLEVLRVDAESIDELRPCIVSHDILGR